jgi:hypothetical protein
MSPRAARPAFGAVAAAMLLGAVPAGAQTLFDRSVRAGPQFVSYSLGDGLDISEFAVPVAVVVPVTSRLNVDVATAYASSTVERAGSGKQSISGLTDTQLRANYTLGSDFIVLTAGLNIPTGTETVEEDQIEAAGFIGNDFLAFPVSNMGTGLAATGGVAVARPFGEWNVGFGASMRHATEYDAFEISDQKVRFQPGNEYRARIGVDRAAGGGRVALGLTYSAFGDDEDAQTTYSTGDRLIAQAAYSVPTAVADIFVSGWNLIRGKGDRAGGLEAPAENIMNLGITAGFRGLGPLIEPSAEFRRWTVDGDAAGTMLNLGLRTRVGLGAIDVYPGATWSTGSFGEGSDDSLSGWRAILTMRYGR